MDVLLQVDMGKLGRVGDEVKVKRGYARNCLIPKGFALPATDGNRAVFESKRKDLEAAAAKRLQEAQTRAKSVEALKLSITANAQRGGKLFGSIGVHDVVRLINDQGVEVVKSEVHLTETIRNIGDYEVLVQLHSDVKVPLTLEVKPSDESISLEVAHAAALLLNSGSEEDDDEFEVASDEDASAEEAAEESAEQPVKDDKPVDKSAEA